MVTFWATERKNKGVSDLRSAAEWTNRKSSCASYFGGGRAYTHKTGQSDARSVDAKEIPGKVGEERGGSAMRSGAEHGGGFDPEPPSFSSFPSPIVETKRRLTHLRLFVPIPNKNATIAEKRTR